MLTSSTSSGLRVLVLGGGGLVGTSVCHALVRRLPVSKLAAAALMPGLEDRDAFVALQEAHPDVKYSFPHGNLFVPREFASLSRGDLIKHTATRAALLDAVYGDEAAAYEENTMVQMMKEFRPDVVVDCVNTATSFAYQDIWTASNTVRAVLDGGSGSQDDIRAATEVLMLSQMAPQLTRHVKHMYKACNEVGTRALVKVGTTGTGGGGFNVPFTHSENRPSNVLLAKTQAGFAHTGLLFLMSRSPGPTTMVREVKPAAMIGYKGVAVTGVQDSNGNASVRRPKTVDLGTVTTLDLREAQDDFQAVGPLRMPIIDTGENGVFTADEFAAITAPGSMEMVTAEHVADVVVAELEGRTTGTDVLSAVDGAVLSPDFLSGSLRERALSALNTLHDLHVKGDDACLPSIALGRLGPPALSKLLYEANLIRDVFGHDLRTLTALDPESMSAALVAACVGPDGTCTSPIVEVAASIGVPTLLPGDVLVRGAAINTPAPSSRAHGGAVVALTKDRIDTWAEEGWVDVRPAQCRQWIQWLTAVSAHTTDEDAELKAGSWAAAPQSQAYAHHHDFVPGDVVAWVLTNVMGGMRVKE